MEAIYPDDAPFELTIIPDELVERLKWASLLPFQSVFYFTIPDIRRKRMRAYYGLTFIMSILWIGLTTYILVWMTTMIGFTFGIPDAVMGLTFIAFGSSIPDAITSILVAKQGILYLFLSFHDNLHFQDFYKNIFKSTDSFFGLKNGIRHSWCPIPAFNYFRQ